MAIDTGTANSCVSIKGVGLIRADTVELEEYQIDLGMGYQFPSYVARHRAYPEIVVAAGQDAYLRLGRVPEHIEVVQPIKRGKIHDEDAFIALLKYLIKTVAPRFEVQKKYSLVKSRLAVGMPRNTTPMELGSTKELIQSKIGSKPYLVSEAVAAAYGAGLQVNDAMTCTVIDIGGGTADVGCMSLGDVIYHECVEIGGDMINERIKLYTRKVHHLGISDRAAEAIKRELACAVPFPKTRVYTVKGASLNNGLPSKEVTLSSEEIYECLKDVLQSLAEGIRNRLNEIGMAEVYSNIFDSGIRLTGGTSLIYGLDELLAKETGFKIHRAEQPLLSVIKGLDVMLQHPELLDRFDMRVQS